ncbi:UNVERIFIED_CONTAM: hypothetical protein PYX00_006001 [Menopon gallinae]|uniref:Centrosomal protein of 97 kDa n=1 Tax=Menopon gallinae TaxID=328185 RepID=A0AAW2HUP1_9NEOP
MESEEKENIDENVEVIVDLSKRSLKKIERANTEQKNAVALILDSNELQRLDNIDSYSTLKRLSVANNRLIRMQNVSCLLNLTVLDMSNNALVCIEGLKDLKELKHLNLCGNKIKIIDHLTNNLNLEYLDLSHNNIGHISDISHLQKLKELSLHNNEIVHLRQCEKNLPNCLETLTLSNNCITDLNEISHLVLLKSLKELSFCNNPCLEFTDSQIDFNYRPFVKNWCSSIVMLDGYPLDDIECLKAEWLYSQGRGRSFRPGEHVALAKYLTSVCPRTERNLESEDEKKLRIILSKAHHHQQQLKEQLSGNSPLPNRQKSASKKHSAIAGDRMVSSYHDAGNGEVTRSLPDLMSRSLDTTLMRNSPVPQNDMSDSFHNPLETATVMLPVPESLTSPDVCRLPHQFPTSADGKLKKANVLRRQNNNSSSPLPPRKCDKLMSPNKSRSVAKVESPKKKPMTVTTVVLAKSNGNDSSDDDSEYSDIKVNKLLLNQNKFKKQAFDYDGKENSNQLLRRDVRDTAVWKAAVCIQRFWRGYRTRNLNREVMEAYKNIQTIRIEDYIMKVANDMEATKVALERHRKLQLLQIQAMNALWKKMVALPPGEGSSSGSRNTLQGLAETCINLNKKVEELQTMMKVMHHSNRGQSIPTATQTEIIAVHTPQGEEQGTFPYYPRLERPNVLLISEQHSDKPVEQYANNLITDAIKKVSSGPDLPSEECRIEQFSNTDKKELDREESICLTPACQEGKDLQSIMVLDENLPTETVENCPSEEKTSTSEVPDESTEPISSHTQQFGSERPSNELVHPSYSCSSS